VIYRSRAQLNVNLTIVHYSYVSAHVYRYLVAKFTEQSPSRLSSWCQLVRNMRWRSWLWHYAIRRKVAGSIPDGVIGIFY
jgi:hypothetical protein